MMLATMLPSSCFSAKNKMQNACLKNIYLFRITFLRLKVNFFRQAFTNLDDNAGFADPSERRLSFSIE